MFRRLTGEIPFQIIDKICEITGEKLVKLFHRSPLQFQLEKTDGTIRRIWLYRLPRFYSDTGYNDTV